eukprot:CAMPEP_0174863492 /NCGR_PEP_ID=MMETSP1114-20130205/56337_1 /TAXON_ID=312471 /ORGANISM="Neobodo designis, Strain CCAP 1951/1" /LENGTH=132 /DNA_ID=CAMNT_0016098557 /DNA_START=146 /DNA_END=545 /DNA_ORIENTATION=-
MARRFATGDTRKNKGAGAPLRMAVGWARLGRHRRRSPNRASVHRSQTLDAIPGHGAPSALVGGGLVAVEGLGLNHPLQPRNGLRGNAPRREHYSCESETAPPLVTARCTHSPLVVDVKRRVPHTKTCTARRE